MGRGNQILEAAEELFYERGFDGVGVDAIAEKAGITGGGIYRHFSGKGEILASIRRSTRCLNGFRRRTTIQTVTCVI